MIGPVTTDALVDGDHDMPTDAEIQAMREEAENFRLPAPPPTPVRGRFYLTECEHCGWVGSSEHCGGSCGPDDDDIVCPVCCSSICGDAPDEADTAKHGEAVYQRIVTAEAERDAALAAHQQVTAERDEARAKLLEFGEMYEREDKRVAAEIDTATAEAASLRAEVEAKDRALKPFAECAEVFRGRDDVGVCFRQVTSGTTFLDPLTIGDFRAARTALARAATAGEGRSDA